MLTKNGYGDMVVMSYEEFEKLQYDIGIAMKLREAEVVCLTCDHPNRDTTYLFKFVQK